MTRLDNALAALTTLPPSEMREQWGETGKGAAPSVPTPLLRRLLAQRLQEKRHGGLPLLVIRELERTASASEAIPEPARRSVVLTPGTRLIREWNGRTITVEVLDGGFLWEERTYRSLSEIAREVTGAHWSGPRFFGLNRRG
tara:strand:- start:53 stop:478 length:426 start_codon:yes stop_codon:yes gene_type:complete